MPRVLASDGIAASAAKKLEELGYEVVQEFYEEDELKEKVKEFDALVVRSATKVREPIIDAAVETGKLKIVIRGGVGVDNIDVAYAESKGIVVKNTPKASTDSVAECTIGHMFALARYIGISNHAMRTGEWPKKQYKGIELAGKTLGLIGMGRIAQSVARKAAALGMNIMYTDIFDIQGLPSDYKKSTKEDILKEADFISLHIPMPKDGKAVIGKEELSTMKSSAYILNLARGGVIDEDALCDALDNKVIAGAALDVFAKEPLSNDRIRNNDKISMTPHIGGSTSEAQDRIGMEIVDILQEQFK